METFVTQYMYFVCIKIGFITFTRKYVLRDVCCMKEPWSDTSGQLTWGYRGSNCNGCLQGNMCLKNHMLFYDYIYPQKWHNWPRNYTIDSFTIIISTIRLPQERHWSKKVYCKWYCWKMKHFLHGIFTFWKFGNIGKDLDGTKSIPKRLIAQKKM